MLIVAAPRPKVPLLQILREELDPAVISGWPGSGCTGTIPGYLDGALGNKSLTANDEIYPGAGCR